MAGLLTIEQGGRIRANLTADSSSTWSRGQLLSVNTSGNLVPATTSTKTVIGIALENCVTSAAGNPKNDTNVIVQGQPAGVLLGEAVVVTDNLSGTGGWTQGASTVYGDASSNLTYNQGGPLVGTVLNCTPAADGKLRFLFRPNLAYTPGSSGLV
jgi:hypothetical protein